MQNITESEFILPCVMVWYISVPSQNENALFHDFMGMTPKEQATKQK